MIYDIVALLGNSAEAMIPIPVQNTLYTGNIEYMTNDEYYIVYTVIFYGFH